VNPAVVFNDTYEWSNDYWGPVSIDVTVTEAQIGGDDVYLWEYAVTNDPDNNMSVGYFAIPALEPDPNYPIGLDGIRLTVGALDTTQTGWMGGIDYATDRPAYATDAYIWWEIGNEPIELGQSGVFSFVTAPTTISSGTGIVKEAPGIAPVIIGAIAVPVAPDPREVTTKSDTGTPDDGLVSLREAVNWVIVNEPQNTQVTFKVNGPIALDPNKGEIELSQTISILGPAVGTITIQRTGGNHRIFNVAHGATVYLTNLELFNGKTPAGQAGGAIRSEGDLTITDCIFMLNEAPDSLGGAIAAIGGSLYLDHCTFTVNSASLGGALYVGQRSPRTSPTPSSRTTMRRARAARSTLSHHQTQLPLPSRC
jgi:hypothetical protein